MLSYIDIYRKLYGTSPNLDYTNFIPMCQTKNAVLIENVSIASKIFSQLLVDIIEILAIIRAGSPFQKYFQQISLRKLLSLIPI